MIIIKNKTAIKKMEEAGKKLASIFEHMHAQLRPGVSTLSLNDWIEGQLKQEGMRSKTKGYRGYRHASCISVNDELVHGVPRGTKFLAEGDMVTVDVCASWQDYCADMARTFFIGEVSQAARDLVDTAQQALDEGISKACAGGRLTDISAAVQQVIEKRGFGVVRDFAGHGIGKQMHEEPEVLNYGIAGKGPVLRPGMTLAIEPMATFGSYEVYITNDGWTVKTVDGLLSAHVEDTVVITDDVPKILTRLA